MEWHSSKYRIGTVGHTERRRPRRRTSRHHRDHPLVPHSILTVLVAKAEIPTSRLNGAALDTLPRQGRASNKLWLICRFVFIGYACLLQQSRQMREVWCNRACLCAGDCDSSILTSIAEAQMTRSNNTSLKRLSWITVSPHPTHASLTRTSSRNSYSFRPCSSRYENCPILILNEANTQAPECFRHEC